MNRILVINDSKFESIILNDILSQLGYNVINTDEYEALNKVLSFSPDIVLVNYIMRDTSGDKLAEVIKSKRPEVKCLLTSSTQLSSGDIGTAIIDAILTTPVTKNKLENAITKLAEDDRSEQIHEVPKDLAADNIKAKLERWKLKTSAAPMPDTTVACSKCGNKLAVGGSEFQFCPYCGNKI